MQATAQNIETLSDKLRVYAARKADKAALDERLKCARARLEEAEADAIDAMMEAMERAGLPSTAGFRVQVDGYNYAVSIKTHYNILAGDRERGFEALREVGLGDLIKEVVDPRTLNSAMRGIAEDHGGELPDEYSVIPLKIYAEPELFARKAAR